MKSSKLFWERAAWLWILLFPLAFAGSFSTSITSQQVNGILAAPGPIGSVTPNTGAFSSVIQSGTGFYKLKNVKLLFSTDAPLIESGFGTAAAIIPSGGYATTQAFQINVGTGGTANSGVVTMPANGYGWACGLTNPLTAAGTLTQQTQSTTSNFTLTNYTISTKVAVAWPASTVLFVKCIGF